ncbi:MAG TPA: hypothetical protein VGK86_01460 [Thermoanaerobaculia bacterium]
MGQRLASWRRVVVETFSKWFAHDAMSQSAARRRAKKQPPRREAP